jgi:ABC-type multidrug transport system permease subunit
LSELNPLYGYAIYLLTQLRTLVHKDLSSRWINQTELCEAFQGYNQFIDSVGAIFKSFDSNEADTYESSKSDILMISLICVFGYFVICFPLLFILSILSFKELETLLKLMQNVDPTSRSEAASPLKAENHEQPTEEHHENFTSSGLKLSGLIILISVFVLSTVSFILIIYFITHSENEKLGIINMWALSDTRRIGLSIFALISSTLLIATNNNILIAPYLNNVTIYQHLNQTLLKLMNSNKNLLGSTESPSILGENSELDQYNFYNICTKFEATGDVSDTYSCSGLISNYERVSALAVSILHDSFSMTFSNNSEWFHLHQIINKYIRVPQKHSTEILQNMVFNSISTYDKHLTIITSVGIILYTCIFCVIYYFVLLINNYFQGALILLRRLSPLSVISNGALFHYLIGKESNQNSSKSTVFALVFQNSQD